MADYPLDETLRRHVALERMKSLSNQLSDAAAKGDIGLMAAIRREREEIFKLYFKVVK